MQVANAIGLCGLDLNSALTKTIKLTSYQFDCLRCRISDIEFTSDNRVCNLDIQVRKIINVALISAVMDDEEACDTIIDCLVVIPHLL